MRSPHGTSLGKYLCAANSSTPPTTLAITATIIATSAESRTARAPSGSGGRGRCDHVSLEITCSANPPKVSMSHSVGLSWWPRNNATPATHTMEIAMGQRPSSRSDQGLALILCFLPGIFELGINRSLSSLQLGRIGGLFDALRDRALLRSGTKAFPRERSYR